MKGRIIAIHIAAVVIATLLTVCQGVAEPQAGPLFQTGYAENQVEIRDIAEIADDFRAPTPEEIKKLGTFWPQVPEAENAAHWFVLAANRLHTENAPAGSLLASYDERYSYAGDLASFEKWMQGNQAALDTLREGLACKAHYTSVVVYGPATGATFDMEYFGQIRRLARALQDAGFLDELKEQTDAAAAAYLDCLRLATIVRLNPTLIEELVATSIIQKAGVSLERLIGAERLNEGTLRAIIAACREAEIGPQEPLAVWERNTAFTEAALAVHGDDPQVREENLVRVGHSAEYAVAVKGILTKKTLDELLQKKVLEEIYAKELKEFMAEEHWLAELGRANVLLRSTQIRAGIALYKKGHAGALPQTLDALCPDILPTVPTDPFSGNPMRYAKTAQGWKVWSVGADNTDNGGTSDTESSRRWAEPDVVFVSHVPSSIEWRSQQVPASGDPRKTE